MKLLNTASYKNGALLSSGLGIMLIVLSLLGGKIELFLLLNEDLGIAADYFFHYLTYLGDGIIWVPLAVFIFIYKKQLFPLLLATIIFSTLIVQGSKQFVFPNEARPAATITNLTQIHTVEGVELHHSNSFPSGHNTTAFSVYLILCLVLSARYFWIIGFFIAALVGYSRVYLAQHFPLDAGAGMLTAVVSVYLSLLIQKRISKN
ncbi:MAG: phosphatase PAP2 family protein [Sediminibacterium sp.]|nr:phosphatase PAP2 family protein [Sediminibacterium sp.]TXT34818.1 MAG: phosphoesterase PA-phosphatase-like protein [Chitinophagaceae bacterium]